MSKVWTRKRRTASMDWRRYVWVIVICLVVAGISTAVAFIPGAWPAALPFLAVMLGIVMRTFVPFVEKILVSVRDEGVWPAFEKRFLLPPLAAVALDVLWLGVTMLTQPGYVQEIAGLGFVIAVMAGYGGQGFIRDVQKLVAASWRT